jgi:hypothetical protein
LDCTLAATIEDPADNPEVVIAPEEKIAAKFFANA